MVVDTVTGRVAARRFGTRSWRLAILVAASAALAACGSGAPGTQGAATTSAPTSATASSTTPASSSAGSSPPTSAAHASAGAIQALLQEGVDQASANQVKMAITTFNDVLLLSPKNTYALYNLGLIEQMQKNTSAAIGYYKRAIASDPTYTPAMYNEAILLEKINLDSALALYQKIVKINPKASTAWLRMAFVYAEQGNTSQADTARAKAIALDPSLSKYPLPAKCSQPNC